MRHALMILLLSVLSFDAYACSCSAQPFHERLDGAQLVFLVRVTQTRFDPAGFELWPPQRGGPVRAKFELVEALKGDPSRVEEIYSAYGGGDCGVPLMSGVYYLVVATAVQQMVPVDMCGASMRLDAVDPRKENKTAQRFRFDAARAYLRDKKPIDPCFDFSDIPPPRKEGGRCEKLIGKMLSSDEIK